jgi:hypothetical protein
MREMADSIAYKDENSDQNRTIKSDEELLEDLDSLISELRETGHSYSADGAIMYTQASIPQLLKERKMFEDRVLLWRGVTGRNTIT